MGKHSRYAGCFDSRASGVVADVRWHRAANHGTDQVVSREPRSVAGMQTRRAAIPDADRVRSHVLVHLVGENVRRAAAPGGRLGGRCRARGRRTGAARAPPQRGKSPQQSSCLAVAWELMTSSWAQSLHSNRPRARHAACGRQSGEVVRSGVRKR